VPVFLQALSFTSSYTQTVKEATLLSFRLSDEFIAKQVEREVPWGFGTLSELTFLRTYSRDKADGGKERWYETCRRVVEGCYSIQKDHCNRYRLPWNEGKAQSSAEEMYERLFTFKFWPAGRILEYLGSDVVHANGDASNLQNCAFLSTKDVQNDAIKPFVLAFSMLMAGVGVGCDLRGADQIYVKRPDPNDYTYSIPDSTEGWVESLRRLLASYLEGDRRVYFDYSQIRPAGAPISSGGIAPGPGPLKAMHKKLRELYDASVGSPLDSRLMADTFNLLGKATASGGKRRAAIIIFGKVDNDTFINLKDYTLPENKERTGPDGWAWSSNNSIMRSSDEELDYNWYAYRQLLNGEPGIANMDITNNYGRLEDGYQEGIDPAEGFNPCGEQALEDKEFCCLATVNQMKHESDEDFLKSIKFAYLVAKSVTLLPTKWEEANAVQMRNRRIGLSTSGVAQFIDGPGSWTQLKNRSDQGYKEVRKWDKMYSNWLGVRESIKVTTVKPEGSASILGGSTPGVHFPVSSTYIKNLRVNKNDPKIAIMEDAGYKVEPDRSDPTSTVVISIPVHIPEQVRAEEDVSVYEKMALVVMLQRYWSDNSVSCTLSFNPHEVDDLARALEMNEGQYKTISCLPLSDAVYEQMPYEPITKEEYDLIRMGLKPVDFSDLYKGTVEDLTQVGDKYCDTDSCTI
jgi:ribonucleoside-triphosphate reductase